MDVSLQGLRVFLAVLEHGSLSAAARELGVSQPGVSNHLNALEERFGVTLLARGGRLRTTPAGECLAEHARRVLQAVSALDAEMAAQIAPRGRFFVAASTTPAELVLPAVAAEFSARYPDVALELRVYDTDEAVARLLERKVEIAVVGREVADPRLDLRVIEEDELSLVIPAGDALAGSYASAEQLSGRAFVLREPGSATRRAAEDALAAAGIEPRVAMELGSNAAVLGAVAAGTGVGIVPSRLLADRKGVVPLRVGGLHLVRPFVLVTEKGRPLSPAAESFAAIAGAAAAATVAASKASQRP